MTDLLNAIRGTSAREQRLAQADERARSRSRKTRLAVFFAGLTVVIAVGVGVAADGDSAPPRTPEAPVTPFVTTDAPPYGGVSSVDG